MSAKQNAIGALIVDCSGRAAGPVIMDADAAAVECRRRNESLRRQVPEIVGDYYHLVDVEVIG